MCGNRYTEPGQFAPRNTYPRTESSANEMKHVQKENVPPSGNGKQQARAYVGDTGKKEE